MKKKTYEQSFKDKIIRLHLEEGRTISSLNKEYQIKEIKNQISQFLINKNLENLKYNIEFTDKLEKNKKTGKVKMVIKDF